MAANVSLKKAITPLQLWAIAVGLVISGEYFGWNYGWGTAGTVGFLLSVLVITLLYGTFIFSFTELTTAIPQAGGPFTYAYRALGPWAALVAGYATLVEFLLATPAIAMALGTYVHFLYPPLPVQATAIVVYLLLTGINLLGIKESAAFTLLMTLLAVAELLLFMGIVAPAFKTSNFMLDALPVSWGGVFAALPFAIWLYVCIEGVAMVAEEVKSPARTIPVGYISGILTLMLLALGVMILSGGATNWHGLTNIDYPLPETIASVLGRSSHFTRLFAGIGLFGLLASFNGIIISYSRQLFALARDRYLPGFLAQVSSRRQTPYWALLCGAGIGISALCLGKTDQLVVLSVLGAIVMYVISMIGLFVLRRKEPGLHRPYHAPGYPWVHALALLLSLLAMGCIVYYNVQISLIFLEGLAVAAVYFFITGKHKRIYTALP
ncbi:ethanolamine:proton symporter, EAT family [Chitinophaga costaii]|uniref:Ethanolamine:proton symporter, EAT family n=1 Tax=Chitinophaga costaii TaxID=1335309 RepID=A0A1C4FN64_9BACT|nr:ethanolamine permease [Chitinophaga costaii]PUZ29915.1 ethanolamine permease [Chitinophaga costaii]SCC57418.1 ethanolamine:proton symporter, EAT family [Chitinophaga costaii]